jgi:hypothetical protein
MQEGEMKTGPRVGSLVVLLAGLVWPQPSSAGERLAHDAPLFLALEDRPLRSQTPAIPHPGSNPPAIAGGAERTAGDNCASPILVSIPAQLPYQNLNQTTCGRADDYWNTCLHPFDDGEDITYQLNVTSTVDVTVTMDPKTSLWTGILVDDSCPPDSTTCLAKVARYDALPRIISPLHLTSGTYWIMVDTCPAPDCIPSFNLSIVLYTPPVGACCLGANCAGTLSQASCTAQGGTWAGPGTNCSTWLCAPADACQASNVLTVPDDVMFSTADLTTDPTPACGTADATMPRSNAWFRLNGTGHTAILTTCAAGTTLEDTALKVFCDCPPLTCVAGCDDDAACTTYQSAAEVDFGRISRGRAANVINGH